MPRLAYSPVSKKWYYTLLITMVTVALLVWTATALPVIQTMTPAPNQTMQMVTTPTPTLVLVTTAQPTLTSTPKATTAVSTMVPATPRPIQTAGPAVTGSREPASTQGITTAGAAGTATPTVGGFRPGGTPVILATATTTAGGSLGSTGSYSTGPKAAAGKDGSPASFAALSPRLAAAIAGTFNEEKLKAASLQGVEVTVDVTGISNQSLALKPSIDGGGDERYDAAVTATKKGNPSLGCEDDSIRISLRNMQPESTVAGLLVSGGSKLMFSDPSIRQINFGGDTMTIESVRHAKFLGIIDIDYTALSKIGPSGMVETGRPFWLVLATGEPRQFTPQEERCRRYDPNQPVGETATAAMTPKVTPTPAPDNQADNLLVCPSDPECNPEMFVRCYNECMNSPVEPNQSFDCYYRSYDFEHNCCSSRCYISNAGDSIADQVALETCLMQCQQLDLGNLAIQVMKDNADASMGVIRNMG